MWQLFTWNVQFSRISELADGYNDVLGIELGRRGQDLEEVSLSGNGSHRCAGTDVELLLSGLLRPGVQHRLPASRRKRKIAAQGNHGRQGHDVLLVLVFLLKRVGKIALFEDEIIEAVVMSPGGGAETCRTSTHDNDVICF